MSNNTQENYFDKIRRKRQNIQQRVKEKNPTFYERNSVEPVKNSTFKPVEVPAINSKLNELLSMNSADIKIKLSEIDEFEKYLESAKKYDGKIKSLQNNQKYITSRSRGMANNFYDDEIETLAKEQKKYLESMGYSSVSDFEKALAEKKIAYITDDGYRISWKELYDDAFLREYENNIKKNADFTEKSTFNKKDAKYEKTWNGYPIIGDEFAHLFNYINEDSEARNKGLILDIPQAGTSDYAKNKFFTDDEKKVFNYLAETQGKEKALKYYNLLNSQLRQRRIQHENKLNTQLAKEDPIGASVVSVMDNLGNNMMSLPFMAMDYAEDGKIDENSSLYTGRRRVNTQRSAVEDNIDSKVGKFFYRHGMGIADNVTTMAMSGFGKLGVTSKVIQTGIMSSGALVDTTLDAKKRGLSDGEAISLGIVAGAAEYLFESKSFDALFDSGTLKESGLRYFLNNLKTEEIGELGTELTNDIADILISQDLSKITTEINNYIKAGNTEKEAFLKAFKNAGLRYLDVAGGTLLSTGVISGGPAVISSYNSKNAQYEAAGAKVVDADRVNEIIDMGLNQPKNSKVYKEAEKLRTQQNNNKDITLRQIGKLYTDLSSPAETITKPVNNKPFTKPETTTENKGEAVNVKETFTNNTPPMPIPINEEVRKFGESFGEKERRFLYSNYKGEGNFDTYKMAFSEYYNAGANNIPFEAVNKRTLPETKAVFPDIVAKTVYSLGQADAKNNFNDVSQYQIESGVVMNDAAKELNQSTLKIIKNLAERTKSTVIVEHGLTDENGETIMGDEKDGVIRINADYKNVARLIAVHEFTHRLQRLAPEAYSKFKKYTVEKMKKDGTYDSAIKALREDYKGLNDEKLNDELCAEMAERLFNNEQELIDFIKKDRTLAERIKDMWLEILDILGRTDEKTHAQLMWKKCLNEATKSNSEAIKTGEVRNKKTTNPYGISVEDISAIQNIPRKSVNKFSSEEIKIAEKFANRMWKELGVKSPFFRVGFGDWRANDNKTKINIVEVNEKIVPDNVSPKNVGVLLRNKLKNNELFRGDITNYDTGYKIQIGTFGYNDTLTYAQRELRKKGVTTEEAFRRINALSEIDKLIQNAILLDTEVINDKDNPNRSFMHSFYIVAKVDGIDKLIKIKVDELESPTNPAKRFYNLNDFEIINKKPLAVNWDLNPSTDANGSKGIAPASISVSDLFNIVKQFDKSFNPKPSSLVINEDGTPKIVYHTTSENFTVFDITKSRSWDGVPDYDLPGFYFSENYEDSASYGNNTMECYIKITKPYTGDVYSLAKEKGSFRKAYNYLIEQGYDGIIIDEFGEGYNEYIVLKPENIKSATDNIGTFDGNNPDIRYKRPGVSEKLDPYIKEFGQMKEGKEPRRDVEVPLRTEKYNRVRQTARTAAESTFLSEEFSDDVLESIAEDKMSYIPISDKDALNYAYSALEELGTDAVSDIVNSSIKAHSLDKKTVALAEVLLQKLDEDGKHKEAQELIVKFAAEGTRMGQSIQAISMLKKLDGKYETVYINEIIDKIEEDIFVKSNGKKKITISVSQELMDKLSNAKTKKEREALREEIFTEIANQFPASWVDKWNAWRYLAMLANPRTHIRNFLGNAFFMPVIGTKNVVAKILEIGAEKVTGGKIERSKTFKVSKEYKEFAMRDAEEMRGELSGGGKYNPADIIKDKQQIFSFKPLEYLRVKNESLLETEDWMFLRRHYQVALSNYLAANKVDLKNIDAETLVKARNTALKEAQRNTYRDLCEFANAISKLSKTNKATALFVEGVLPFKKTPINILRRGVEYSPAGLAKSLFYDIGKVQKGEITASEWIDTLSRGLTGTMVVVLGMLLKSLGFIEGASGDEKEKEFEELQGFQNYSLQIGKHSYTLDWLAPTALPFFVGVELKTALEEKGKIGLRDALEVLGNITEPMFEMSMLQGLTDAITTTQNASNAEKAAKIASTVVQNYFGQAVPTIFGQIARTIDDTRRTIYDDKNKDIPGSIQYAVQSTARKLPGASKTLQPYVDNWGRKEITEGIFKRAFLNFLSPGYYSKVETSDMEKELMRLYDEVGDEDGMSLFPKRAVKKFELSDGTEKELSADEWTLMQEAQGKSAYKLLDGILNSPEYESNDDEAKGKIVTKVYELSRACAKKEIVGDEWSGSKWIEEAVSLIDDNDYSAAGDYLIYNTLKSDDILGKKEARSFAFKELDDIPEEIWLKELSESQTKKYNTYIKGSGINVKDYISALDYKNGLETINKGKSNEITPKEQMIKYINKLNITREQKRKLYISLGYSEKTCPW